ncbi:MAG: LysM peptidoglycan-binding domain-containing protein, partial [Anaerolineae bacterium]
MSSSPALLSGGLPASRWLCLPALGMICLFTACYRPQPEPRGSQGKQSGRAKTSSSVAVTADAGASSSGASGPAPTLASTPSPAYPGTYSGTPTPNSTPVGYGEGTGVEIYTVQPGETLSLIASVFGCTIEEIVVANGLASADSIVAGQPLRIPTMATHMGPSLKLIPDSEMVYGPATIHFDLGGFIMQQGGYLAGYAEQVEGELRTGPEIVQIVSQRFSVGPRALLALLEMQSGWVTQAQPRGETLVYPLGHVQDYQEGL